MSKKQILSDQDLIRKKILTNFKNATEGQKYVAIVAIKEKNTSEKNKRKNSHFSKTSDKVNGIVNSMLKPLKQSILRNYKAQSEEIS